MRIGSGKSLSDDLRNLPRTRLCFPDMSGNINCMHSKLQLLSHPTHLRVAVPTANLVPYDWGEAMGTGKSEGVMENVGITMLLFRTSQLAHGGC